MNICSKSWRGKLTDNVGRVINFRNTIILSDLQRRLGNDPRGATMGFLHQRRAQLRQDEGKNHGRCQEGVSSEFMNRLDDVIVFRTLVKADLLEIWSWKFPSDGTSQGKTIGVGAGSDGERFPGGEGSIRITERVRCAAVERYLEDRWPRRSSKQFASQRTDHRRGEEDKLVFKQNASAKPEALSS